MSAEHAGCWCERTPCSRMALGGQQCARGRREVAQEAHDRGCMRRACRPVPPCRESHTAYVRLHARVWAADIHQPQTASDTKPRTRGARVAARTITVVANGAAPARERLPVPLESRRASMNDCRPTLTCCRRTLKRSPPKWWWVFATASRRNGPPHQSGPPRLHHHS